MIVTAMIVVKVTEAAAAAAFAISAYQSMAFVAKVVRVRCVVVVLMALF